MKKSANWWLQWLTIRAPWWKFWMPDSGLIGGVLMGIMFWLVLGLLKLVGLP